jgi:hypothetical protein
MFPLLPSLANDPLIERCQKVCREAQQVRAETELRLLESCAAQEAAYQGRQAYRSWLLQQTPQWRDNSDS